MQVNVKVRGENMTFLARMRHYSGKLPGASIYILGAGIGFLGILLFSGSLGNAFVNWDDDLYIYENRAIRSLGSASLKQFLVGFHAGNWHPLTWFSHAVDYAVWGLNPAGHHLTSLLLHGLNTFLVVVITFQLLQLAMGDEQGGGTHPLSQNLLLVAASVTGLLFGLHPMHVESVAWASERKDLLSAFFYLLSLLLYLRYATPECRKASEKSSRWWRDWNLQASLFFFVSALLSKAMAVTLPVVLLLLDWYPLSRFRTKGKVGVILAEKVPFLLLSSVTAGITFFAQRSARYVVPLESFPLGDRVIISFYALIAYLGKLLWPQTLSPFYPMPGQISIARTEFLLPILLVTAISVACLLLVRRQKFWFLLWSFFCVTLLPVLGVVKTGLQVMADRYIYLSAMAPFMLIGLCVASALKVTRQRRFHALSAGIIIATLLVISLLAFRTLKQVRIWKGGISYWSSVLERAPLDIMTASRSQNGQSVRQDLNVSDAWVVTSLHNRAKAYAEAGHYAESIQDLNSAVVLGNAIPAYPNEINYFYRGYVLIKMGRYEEAGQDLAAAILRKKDYYDAYYMQGVAYLWAGNASKSLESMNEALRLCPEPPYNYFHDRAIAFARLGDYKKAVADYTEAIRLNPASSDSYRNRGTLYRKLGLLPEAEMDLLKAESLKSDR